MVGQKYKVVLNRKYEFVDNSKDKADRYLATMGPGEFIAEQIENPSGDPEHSNWLMFEGTTIGATVDYFRTVAASIKPA